MSAFLLALHAGVRNRVEESVPSSSCWLIQCGNTHTFLFLFFRTLASSLFQIFAM